MWSYHTLTLFRFFWLHVINIVLVVLALQARLGITGSASEFLERQFVLCRAVSRFSVTGIQGNTL